MRFTTAIQFFGMAAAVAVSGAAMAQQTGAPIAVPGSADASKVSSANHENNSSYNHLVSQGDGTTKTDTDRSSRPSKAGPAVPATAADIAPGKPFRDMHGVPLGTVVLLQGDGVIVDTGASKISVPLIAFGKDANGLLLGISARKFQQLVSKAVASN